MAHVLMYTSGYCPYCVQAERLLVSKGVTDIEKVRVDTDPARRTEMMEKTGRRTVPQIYIDDFHEQGEQSGGDSGFHGDSRRRSRRTHPAPALTRKQSPLRPALLRL